VHTDIRLWSTVRRRVLVEGASKRSVCRDYSLGWSTLEKILTHAEPPGYRSSAERAKPKLGDFLGIIDEILEADTEAPPKQRHTARRIFERLRDEYGYRGGIAQVRQAVAQARRSSKEVFLPMSHRPGRAQFDFGEATVEIAGEHTNVALGVMTLPCSDAYFVQAYPRECTETFHAAHVAAFEFFGGVPTRIDYDNTTIAVKKVLQGSDRALTREFLRLESHFLFDHRFCRVGRGNEKGHVEAHVGYVRRNLLVPVPSFGSFGALNEYLTSCCYADLFRRVRGKPAPKVERLEIDREAMLPSPNEPFRVRRMVERKVNSFSLVSFDGNEYSVPTAHAHQDVTVIGNLNEVRILVGSTVVACHPRLWIKEQTTYDPRHYLSLLARKPGAFDEAKPLDGWELPDCFAVLRRRLETNLGSTGTREFIDVLRLLEDTSMQELTAAVEIALSIDTISSDAIRLIVAWRAEGKSELFSLDGLVYFKPFAIDLPDLRSYSSLARIGK
jgi:transposase